MSETHGDKLTKDAVRRILVGEGVSKPNLQVLAYKKVSNGRRRRYRFVLSDGTFSHACFCMMGDVLVDRLEQGEFERFTIVQLNKYVCNKVAERKTIVILETEVRYKCTEIAVKIGNPTDLPSSQVLSSKDASKSPLRLPSLGVSKLTFGCIIRILNGENVPRPCVQILAYKQILNEGCKRYRCVVSDGLYSHQCCVLMGEAIVSRLEKGEFERFSILQLNQYVCNVISGKKILIIVDAETKYKVTAKIGNPGALPSDASAFPHVCNSTAKDQCVKLTTGAISRILNDEDVSQPNLQVLLFKELLEEDGDKHFQLCLSDGLLMHQCFFILNSDVVAHVDGSAVQRYSVIQLNKYTRSNYKGRKVIVVVDFDVKHSSQDVGGKLGSPTVLPLPDVPGITESFCELLKI